MGQQRLWARQRQAAERAIQAGLAAGAASAANRRADLERNAAVQALIATMGERIGRLEARVAVLEASGVR